MSNQNYYQQGSQDHQNQSVPNSNPWADQVSQHGQQPQQPPQQQQQQYGAPQGYSAPQGYNPPQGHNPPQGYSAPPGVPPRRTGTFEESQFLSQEERGEQREAMEEFEMNRSKPESQTDRDVATLQEEFPNLDGSLIAALYGDSQSLSGTREMLQELASSQGQR